MKQMNLACLIVLWSVVSSASEPPSQVNLVSVLANPRAYDGKLIVVSGYLCRAQSEQFGLFLVRSDCGDANYSNAIEIDVSDIPKKLPSKPVLLTVEGRFSDRSLRVFVDENFVWGVIEASNISGRTIR